MLQYGCHATYLDALEECNNPAIEVLDLRAVQSEYTYFETFSTPDFAAELPKYTGINDHPMDLVGRQQPVCKSIHRDRVDLPTWSPDPTAFQAHPLSKVPC